MPVVIRNKTNSVEIDIHSNLKYEVSKGAYDVIYEDTGATATTPAMVYVVLRSSSIINNTIALDWRDVTVQPGDIVFSNAEELKDALLEWNIPKAAVSVYEMAGVISTVNSLNTGLGVAEVFTGSAEDVSGYKSIGVIIYATQLSAVDGFQAQFSINGTDWILTHSFTIPVTTGKFFNLPVEARYFRIVYTNGGLPANVSIQTIYHTTVTKESTLRLSEEIDGETAAQLSRTVLAGQINGSFRNITLDELTNILPIIEDAHHQIHEERSFSAYHTRVTAASNGHRTGLYIKTPASPKRCHLIVSFSASSAAVFSICEAPTIAANTGTHNNVIYNRERDSIIASGCYDNSAAPLMNRFTTLTEVQIAADGTWDAGTIIRSEPLTIGTVPKPAGGSTRDTQEYVLKANTAYVFLLTNTTADANTHYIIIDWYEHTTT